ncbi:DUF896 domain-containing protein [Anaerolentibacter hominis]|uniref:DUF896 domain-containing protein n=1 Tax=Anaerolentibacter hominis TaxID=3079009 RepID=UPI0031B7EFF7
MDEKKIARINELYHKSKQIGLSEEEAREQLDLRAEYLAAVRNNLRGHLDRISILNPDGTVTDLSKEKN